MMDDILKLINAGEVSGNDIKAGTSMPRNMFLFNNAIYLLPYTGIKVSKSGWQVFVHHLEMVAWSLPNISANHLFECLVTANMIFNLFTSFFAIHYYKISKYACKSTKMISEKGKIFSKHLRNMQIIEYFTILFLSLIIIKYERKKVVLEIFELRLTQR